MKKVSHFLLGCLMMITSITSFGQSQKRAAELLSNTAKYYLENDYQVILTYVLKSGKGKVLESYDGFMVKKSGQSYTKIGPVEYIQDSKSFLKINHDEKAMVFSKGEGDMAGQVRALEEMVNAYEKVVVREERDHFRVEMKPGALRQNQYESVVLFISKKDYRFLKHIMVLPHDAGGSPSGGDIILETGFKMAGNLLKKEDGHKLLLGSYLGDLKNASPIGEYKNYEFIDTTKI